MDSIRKFSKKINTKMLIAVILLILLIIVFFKNYNNSISEGFQSEELNSIESEDTNSGNIVPLADCSNVDLLNYNNRSINSIIVSNNIRYGFFSNIDSINYREIIVSLLDDPTDSQSESSMNVIRLFEVSSLYNPIIVTPAEFKFVNNDDVFPTIEEGYDFNNILIVFKINNFVRGTIQDFGVLFENKFFELRLYEMSAVNSIKKFNLYLVNKFTAGNIGFQIDSDVINIELNKYYFARISTTDEGNSIKKVCLTLVEMEMNPRNNIYYKAIGNFELSNIKDLNSNTFKEEYQTSDTPYDGILKCENTGIGRTIESLSQNSNTISNSIATLNMDFAFVGIGGGKKIGISDMPPLPPITTTTTTVPPPINTPQATVYSAPAENSYNYDFDDIRDYLESIVNPQTSTNSQVETFTDIKKIKNIEEYNNTLQSKDNFNNYLFESKEGFEDYTEGFSNCKIIDLTSLKEYLGSKSLQHYTLYHNNRDNIQGMISLFHYQYVNHLNEIVTNFVNQEIESGRCESIGGSSRNSNNHCLISNYYMAESFNIMIKNLLKNYIENVFNRKIEVNGQERQNPFIDQLIINYNTYNTEPSGINNEINTFINELINNHGLNLDFVVNIRYNNL